MKPSHHQNLEFQFSLSQARRIVQDLFAPRPWIYWVDFLASYAAGVYSFQKVRGGNLLTPHQGVTGEPAQILYFAASCILFYRCAMFIHELVHQRTGTLTGFRIVWNLLCGIPFLVPSFVYYTHVDHHRRQHYGTERDGEYMPLGHRSPWYILFYLSWAFFIPLLAFVRFTLLTPLAWLFPPVRRIVHQRASSLVMDPSYIRPLPTKKVLRLIQLQEVGCFLWWWGILIVPALVLDRAPIPFLIHAYATAVVVVLLNSLRTLGSHRWTNDGGRMTFLEQLLDSVNYPHRAGITELWGPVGTRYHAVHHLFPSMPYHNLGAAHRRLAQQLPPGSLYRQTEARSLLAVIGDLWQRAGEGVRVEG